MTLPSSVGSPTTSSSTPSTSQPPRKRPRSDMTTEEKRDARAHRNRVAAQNSRDKRKNQFATLEQRVAELESENQQLRTAMVTAQPDMTLFLSSSINEREQARERENQELRERIKVLEQGWSSVVQALAAAGQAIPILGLPPSMTQEKSLALQDTSSISERDSSPDIKLEYPGTPSSTSLTSSPSLTFSSFTAASDDSTRHLARMANASDSLIGVPEASLQRVGALSTRPLLRTSSYRLKIRRPQRRRIFRSTLGCKTSCNPPSSLLPHQRRRLLFLILLRSISNHRSPNIR